MLLPFSLAAGLSCPTHADLAAALAAEFHPVDEDAVDAALDAIAVSLTPARDADADDQLDELQSAMSVFEPLAAPLEAGAVHIDVAIERLAGHPTTLAVIGAEEQAPALGRRKEVRYSREHRAHERTAADPHAQAPGSGGKEASGRGETDQADRGHQHAADQERLAPESVGGRPGE